MTQVRWRTFFMIDNTGARCKLIIRKLILLQLETGTAVVAHVCSCADHHSRITLINDGHFLSLPPFHNRNNLALEGGDFPSLWMLTWKEQAIPDVVHKDSKPDKGLLNHLLPYPLVHLSSQLEGPETTTSIKLMRTMYLKSALVVDHSTWINSVNSPLSSYKL